MKSAEGSSLVQTGRYSYGSAIDNGAPDPFGYSRHSRSPSEDMSILTSMSVDDTSSMTTLS